MGAVLCYYLNITPNIQELVFLCHSSKRSIIHLIKMLPFAAVCGNHFVMKIGSPIILDGNLTFSPYNEALPISARCWLSVLLLLRPALPTLALSAQAAGALYCLCPANELTRRT